MKSNCEVKLRRPQWIVPAITWLWLLSTLADSLSSPSILPMLSLCVDGRMGSITFDRPLDPTTATNIANYEVVSHSSRIESLFLRDGATNVIFRLGHEIFDEFMALSVNGLRSATGFSIDPSTNVIRVSALYPIVLGTTNANPVMSGEIVLKNHRIAQFRPSIGEITNRSDKCLFLPRQYDSGLRLINGFVTVPIPSVGSSVVSGLMIRESLEKDAVSHSLVVLRPDLRRLAPPQVMIVSRNKMGEVAHIEQLPGPNVPDSGESMMDMRFLRSIDGIIKLTFTTKFGTLFPYKLLDTAELFRSEIYFGAVTFLNAEDPNPKSIEIHSFPGVGELNPWQPISVNLMNTPEGLVFTWSESYVYPLYHLVSAQRVDGPYVSVPIIPTHSSDGFAKAVLLHPNSAKTFYRLRTLRW